MRVTEKVLCFYCYWLCWVDKAVGLLGWCLKDNRMNWLTVKVWQLLRGFVFLLLLVVLVWYSGWFVGLIFKRQQNELTYGRIVTVTERVLCLYCYWLCWFDIAFGLLVWCLEDNRMNRLTLKMWHLLRGFCVSTVIGCVVLI